MPKSILRVTCITCSATWDKRADSVKRWAGECRACANKRVGAMPEVKAARRLSPTIFKKGHKGGGYFKTGPEHHRWDSSWPVCSCGKRLSVRTAKTCRPCRTRSSPRTPKEPQEDLRLRPDWTANLMVRESFRATAAYVRWRKAIVALSPVCQDCGGMGPLTLDHVVPLSALAIASMEACNTRILCYPCHRKTPTWGARQTKAMNILRKSGSNWLELARSNNGA